MDLTLEDDTIYRSCLRSISELNLLEIVERATTQPVHIPGPTACRFSDFLSGAEFLSLATQYRHTGIQDTPCIYAASRGKRFRAIADALESACEWSDDPRGDCHQFLSAAGGLTIRLTDLDLMSRQIRILKTAIFDSTRTQRGEVHGFYTTPHSNAAIPAHRDCGVQIAYQTAGEKIWYFGETGEARIHVKEGDILIIPLGLWHKTQTEDDYSIHMVFMLDPIPELVAMQMMTSVWSLGSTV